MTMVVAEGITQIILGIGMHALNKSHWYLMDAYEILHHDGISWNFQLFQPWLETQYSQKATSVRR